MIKFPSAPFFDLPLKICVLAVVYFLAGKLIMLMEISPMYPADIWPAAGIALGGTLLFGYRVWPGILIGSFLVSQLMFIETSGTVAISPQSLFISSVVFRGRCVASC